MKFRNKKLNNIIRKGLALSLIVSMMSSMLPSPPAKAAESNFSITDTMIKDYHKQTTNAGYPQTAHRKGKERIILLSEFLASVNPDMDKILSDSYGDHQTSDVVWNPSQDQVDKNRDLYFQL